MYRSLLIIACLFACNAVPKCEAFYEDCSANPGNTASLSISGCGGEVCYVQKGSIVNVTINFTPRGIVPDGRMDIWGILDHNSGYVLIDGQANDFCSKTSPTCPLQPDLEYTYSWSQPVSLDYGACTLLIKLIDDADNVIVCLQVNLNISR